MWDLNDVPEQEAVEAEREMWDEITNGDRQATMADAHAEWHRNTGVPMGTPGCPQDACHPDEYDDEPTVGQEAARDHQRRWREDPVNGGIRATAPATPTGTVTWTKLRDDSWGVRGPAALVREGEEVVVTKRSGVTGRALVRRVIWTGTDERAGEEISLASVTRL